MLTCNRETVSDISIVDLNLFFSFFNFTVIIPQEEVMSIRKILFILVTRVFIGGDHNSKKIVLLCGGSTKPITCAIYIS